MYEQVEWKENKGCHCYSLLLSAETHVVLHLTVAEKRHNMCPAMWVQLSGSTGERKLR